MAKKTASQSTTGRRTKVKNLPAKEKKLSKKEQQNVQGGLIGLLIPSATKQIADSSITDGTSNSSITDGTYNAALLPAIQKP